MFDFRLQVFHAVAKRLNFTKASKELYISQPAVSKHISAIETHFKVKLFERNGTKIKLTDAGETLLKYTEQLFAVHRQLEFEMDNISQQHHGILRIGASTTIAQYILPPILAAFHKRYQDMRVNLTIGNSEEIERRLESKEIDLGITEGQTKSNLFKYTEFIKDELVLVANSNHPLIAKELITRDELMNIPLLLREPGSGTLGVLTHALKSIRITLSQLKTEIQLGSTESMKMYLFNSDAMAFLSIHSIFKELQHKEYAILEVEGLSIERYFYFIEPHGEDSSLAQLFLNFSRSYNFK